MKRFFNQFLSLKFFLFDLKKKKKVKKKTK